MESSILKFEKILYEPSEVKLNWQQISQDLKQIEEVSLLKSKFYLSTDIGLEFFYQSIFDETGAVQIKSKDFQKYSSKFGDYFRYSWKGVNIRTVKNSNHVFLRGPIYYLNYMDLDSQITLIKITEELNEVENLINEFLTADSNSFDLNDFLLLLGLLDNRKQLALQLLFVLNQFTRITTEPLINRNQYIKFINYCQSTVDDFYLTLITRSIGDYLCSFKSSQLTNIVDILIGFSLKNKDLIERNKNKFYRKFREASHPYHNALLAKYWSQENSINNYFDYILGIEYGGIELPFVLNAFSRHYTGKIYEIGFLKYSSYSQKTDSDLKSKSSFAFEEPKIENKRILLLDDNILTGRTLKLAINDINELKAKSLYLGFIGFSGEKRFHQMIMPEHGCINPQLLLQGSAIVTESPYTRIYNSRSYTNSNGVFNKVENKVTKYLSKNAPNIQFKF